jgi:lipopolysaccharide biosynthesis glycosyltransferase
MSTPPCCVVYTTDETYLFPTLVSAIQARRFASRAGADVLICHFGVSKSAEAVFAGICAQEGIGLLAVDPRSVENATPMLSRLFLDRFVPDGYAQILYIDGDVRIVRSLDPLIGADVPDGHFLAANDPMTFMLPAADAQSRALAGHLASIGLAPAQAAAYFNTGVLRIARAGWDGIGAQAWRLVQDRRGTFRFPDQDPLNMVAGERRMAMSLAWNFPIFLCNARVEAQIRPSVYHFMSNPKPWQGAFAPWNADVFMSYVAIARQYPSLAAFNPSLPARTRARYTLQQLAKKAIETARWGFGDRRSRILGYEAATQPLLQA